MAHKHTLCIYDSSHHLQIFNGNTFTESRCLNINITDYHEHLQIKLRDASDFVFNYTTQINLRQFELIKIEQCLDINFNEFRTNLIDMLHQVQKHEMFLKCELDSNNTAKLVFYGKSKIKAIVFLVIDLQITSQTEIFNEMNESILELQNANKNLTLQLQMSKTRLEDKENEIETCLSLNKQLEKRFYKDLENLNNVFTNKMQECSAILLQRILLLTQKLFKLIQDVEIVKAEAMLKSDSSARLVQSLENLRLESVETSRTINDLKRENCNLKAIQLSNEKRINELNHKVHQQEIECEQLKQQRDEFEGDAKQGALIIAQKTTANEELAKDVVKANQMLVSFNHLLDTKNQEIENLKSTITSQDNILKENKNRFQELCREFEEYKAEFNSERLNKVSQDLFVAQRKVEEVEKVNRETAKLNELLTRKLASGDFARANFRS